MEVFSAMEKPVADFSLILIKSIFESVEQNNDRGFWFFPLLPILQADSLVISENVRGMKWRAEVSVI